ncbi:MAG TPA: ABC transporter ATP-binding protein [Pirellulales bacterium]|jgi:lipoprotein-releasing system ATP-binding protein|nr:ABC transporter ATP-binding protein [Pirellulales bacterium]
MPELAVRDLTKQFPTRAESLEVLRGVSLALSAGKNLAILGPSGSGKSTLLHIVGTLDRPTSGEVRLDGEDPFVLDEPKLADFRSGRIGFIFQDHHLLPQCSVLENVLLPTLAQGATDNDDLERAKMLLDRVGLAARLEHRPSELSGGERQRVAVARALIRKPVLLLADEPTGNLDRTTAASVAKLLLELQELEQTMMITVTHSLELAAMFQRRMELDEGRLKDRN